MNIIRHVSSAVKETGMEAIDTLKSKNGDTDSEKTLSVSDQLVRDEYFKAMSWHSFSL